MDFNTRLVRVDFYFMTRAMKIKRSSDLTVFTLYRKGLFYKYYNEDAMLFVEPGKRFKISSKLIKSVESNVRSIGQLILTYRPLIAFAKMWIQELSVVR